MKTSQQTIEARQRHHNALAMLYTNLTGKSESGLKLWRRLVRIERDAHAMATIYCNVGLPQHEVDSAVDDITRRVSKVFMGKVPRGFYVNLDARGHALKLDDKPYPELDLHSDWGNNQILAPTID